MGDPKITHVVGTISILIFIETYKMSPYPKVSLIKVLEEFCASTKVQNCAYLHRDMFLFTNLLLNCREVDTGIKSLAERVSDKKDRNQHKKCGNQPESWFGHCTTAAVVGGSGGATV